MHVGNYRIEHAVGGGLFEARHAVLPRRALIKTGQSCNVAVPLTAIQYSSAGTVVQVIRHNRVETKRVEIGLMSSGNVEVRNGLNEGDVVVARAGALLREGDPVRPVMASAEAK